ncbi:hypothetical protein, partial [Candidatus Accumulibacter phosphatis]|uniref:hypothetical protein n=1 Tax=Candidatus Accumulibacter phosphatis TaxID=327160 RepID=UPI001B7F0A5E
QPVGGPIPIHRYRKHRKSRREHRADQVAQLAEKISIPRAAVSGESDIVVCAPPAPRSCRRRSRSTVRTLSTN